MYLDLLWGGETTMLHYFRNTRFALFKALSKAKYITKDTSDKQLLRRANYIFYDMAGYGKQIKKADLTTLAKANTSFSDIDGDPLEQHVLLTTYGHLIIEMCASVPSRRNVKYARKVLEFLIQKKGKDYLMFLVNYLNSDDCVFLLTKIMKHKVDDYGYVSTTLLGLCREATEDIIMKGFQILEHQLVSNELAHIFFSTNVLLDNYKGDLPNLYLRALTFIMFYDELYDVREYTRETLFSTITGIDPSDLTNCIKFTFENLDHSSRMFLENIMLQVLIDVATIKPWHAHAVITYALRPTMLSRLYDLDVEYSKKLSSIMPNDMLQYILTAKEPLEPYSLLLRYNFLPDSEDMNQLFINEFIELYSNHNSQFK